MLNQIIEIVKKAGEIYRSAGDDLGICKKSSSVDLVTKYDKKIQDFLYTELKKVVPDAQLFG